MKILLTGGAGFIGHNVVRHLESIGHECCIIDSLTGYGFVPKEEVDYLNENRLKRIKTTLNIFDIRDVAQVNSIVDKFRPDVVIHLASFPRQKIVTEAPLLASDVMTTGLITLLEASKNYQVKKFVYISSSMIYGDFETDVTETAQCSPIGQYGILKYAGEKLVEEYTRRGAFDHVIIRPSAVYGEWDVEDRVVSKFMTKAMRGETLKVNGASEVLDFTYVEDTAMGITLAATKSISSNKIYNITRSAGRLWTLKDAAELAISITGKGSLELGDRDLDFPKRGRLDITRAIRELGYAPTTNVEEGFEKYYEWYKLNPTLWRK